MHPIKNKISVLLLLWGVLCAVGRAQSVVPPVEPRVAYSEVEALSDTICKGSSLSVNGQLFQWGVDVRVISVKTTQGEEVDKDGKVSPTENTEYILTYHTSAPGTKTASAFVTVLEQAYIHVVGDTVGGDVCPDQTLSFRVDSMSFVQGDVCWKLSTESDLSYGTEFSFTPTQSCELYIRASNNYCGSNEKIINFNYLPTLAFTNYNLLLQIPEYATCMECHFDLPDSSDWKTRAVDGEIENVRLTWEDGSTNEKTLSGEWNAFTCKAEFTIKKSNICGHIEKDTFQLIDINVRGLQCRPTMYSPESALSPCEWAPIYLYAPDVDTNHIISYTNASYEIYPSWSDLNVKDTVLYSTAISSIGWEQVFYLRPHDMNGAEEVYDIIYSANYTVACPYNETTPTISKSVTVDTSIRMDAELIEVEYTYCDRYPGKLLINGKKIKIDKVQFENVPQDSLMLKFFGINQINYNTVHPIRNRLNPNIDRYAELYMNIQVSRDLNDCHFGASIVKRAELVMENYCEPGFTYDYDWNPFDYMSHCVGSDHEVKYTAPLYYQYVDSLKILSTSFILSSEIDNAGSTKQYTCRFRPYFSSKSEEEAGVQEGAVKFVGYYHDIETNEVFRDTIEWPLEIRPCPPIVQSALNPECSPSEDCLACPGSEWVTSIGFVNPSTDPEKIKIQWTKPPVGRNAEEILDTDEPDGDDLLPTTLWDSYAAFWRSRYWLYESSDFSLEITYNEGDSVRTLHMDSSFLVNTTCAPRLEIQRDSCCVGDTLSLHFYADFYRYYLQNAQWEDPSSEVYGTGKEDYNYPIGKPYNRPRLAYKTAVQQPGLYPYMVQYKVNDTLLTYSDTLLIHAATNPKIFTEDSIYVCAGGSVDLRDYIDSSVVKEVLVSLSGDMLKTNINTDRIYSLTARMHYTCWDGNMKTNNLYVFAEKDVFLSCDDSLRLICPLDSVPLEVTSNGRLHWMKRRWNEGIWETENDTIWKSVRYNRSIFDKLGADSVLYKVVAFTACQTPPITKEFKAASQPVPKLHFSDLYACYPDSLHPNFVSSGMSLLEGTEQWFLKEEALRPPYAPTFDTTPIKVMVKGENGCWAQGVDSIYNYPLPQSLLQGCDTLCEHDTVSLFYVHTARELYPDQNSFVWYAPGRPPVSASSADTVHFSQGDVQTADTGWYTVQMNYGVCHWLDSLHLTVHPIPYPALPIDTFFCEKHYIDLDAFNPDYPDGVYEWQEDLIPLPGAGGYDQYTVVRVSDSGRYTVILTANGCTGERAVKVEQRPLPVFYLPTDTLICRGAECVFHLPDHYDAYAWYKDEGDYSTMVGNGSWHSYLDSGRVWVEVMHRGCVDTLESYIERYFCGRLYFPSAFTPDGNNINEQFGPITPALFADLYYELTIVNRNNQVVFHSTDPQEKWDGTFKGIPCRPDTYVYTCKATVRRSGRDVSMSGRVVLIR